MPKPSPRVTGVFGCGHAFEPSNVVEYYNKVLDITQTRCNVCHLRGARSWYRRKGQKLRAGQRAARGAVPRTLGELYPKDGE